MPHAWKSYPHLDAEVMRICVQCDHTEVLSAKGEVLRVLRQGDSFQRTYRCGEKGVPDHMK